VPPTPPPVTGRPPIHALCALMIGHLPHEQRRLADKPANPQSLQKK
jgi:hypothetical protein